MKGIMFMFALIGILMMGTNRQSEVAQLRLATTQFQRLDAAQAAGYRLMPGLDQCLRHSTFGGLGYRYINTSLLDATVDVLHPEALVYVPGPNGGLQLAAVEYIVPVSVWQASQTGWPKIKGQQFHLNPGLNAYVLNLWIWENNPSGIFEDWNPRVSCS